MGEIFLATDNDLLREVAMKVLRRDREQDEDLKMRFLSEAQATSQLEHPGIPPVHDIDLTEDGRIYFTMKRVRGSTLEEILMGLLLKRRQLQQEYTLHRLATVVERIAETLHFAHEQGVIHRDIKPENIMLGDYGEVHVMDWGIARVETATQSDTDEGLERVETDRVRAGRMTTDGSMAGTPAWMSPEQLQGWSEKLDGRTDIYSLGCVLYQILTLYPPFDPDDGDLMSRVTAGDFIDPRERNPGRAVPEPLALIAERAMATEADNRYATPREMADDLRAWLDGRAERSRRRTEATHLSTRGLEAVSEYRRLRAEILKQEARVKLETGRVKEWQALDEKRDLLEARSKLEEMRRGAFNAFNEALHLLQAALFQWKGRARGAGGDRGAHGDVPQ